MDSARVLSLNVGKGIPQSYTTAKVTGIDKKPVASMVVRDPGPKRGGLGSGVVGDVIGDHRHHGGHTQAVYAYAREDLDFWQGELRRALSPGIFGENLTTLGVDCTQARLGELWHIGEVVLKVEAPRIPCATFAGHMGERRWVKRFTAAGRTGAYLSVVTPGTIRVDDPIVVERPDHDIDLLMHFRGVMGDRAMAKKVLDAGVLDPEEAAYLARRA